MITIPNCIWEPVHAGLGPSNAALPQLNDAPPKGQQLLLYLGVAGNVLFKFGLPEIVAGTWSGGIAAPGMPVPEATMNKNAEPIARKHQIRLSWKIFLVKAVSEPLPMEHASYLHFR